MERGAAAAADVDGVIGQLRQELVALGAAHHPYLLRRRRALHRGAGAVLLTRHAQCRRLLRPDGIPRPAANQSQSQHQPPPPPRRTHTRRWVESREREAAALRGGPAGNRGAMREKGESGREEAGEQDAQSGRGRKREKREDGWRGNRERPGAHNRNATQRQEGEGEEEAEQAGDRDEAPLFRLSLSLSHSRRAGWRWEWDAQMLKCPAQAVRR